MREDRKDEVLVSVVMPAYRCVRTIEKAIESVLIQDVPLELLVLNDQSPDELDQLMERYADEPRVRYLKNEQNMGAAATRNRGVMLAKGSYIAFLDSDDWWSAGKLKVQLQQMEKKQAVLCSTARELVTPDGELTGRVIPVKEQISYASLLLHNCINCSSVLIRTEVAREFPMEHEDSHEDYIMWLKVLKKYEKAVAINEPMLKYRLTSSGKSGSKLKSARMTYQVYRYAGFGTLSSIALFCTYAVNGVLKYSKTYLQKYNTKHK